MKLSNKQIHIFIIILGIVFLIIPVFHSNLWFDESYTVGMVNKSFSDIWNIGKYDVHPVLYYWIVHIIYLIFGNNILIYRMFSAFCTAIVGILGYTHIRKDFGEKTGIIFSILVYFLPVNVVYAGEIRMYSLAMLLVTLMCIYAYRIYKSKDKKMVKNWILFAIFSFTSAFTHYYGLMIAFLINLILFIIFVIQSVKAKKITYNLKAFIISALPQILLYLPWLLTLFQKVSEPGAFWIAIRFPESYVEFFTFPFTGNLIGNEYVPIPIAIIFGVLIYTYLIYVHIKNRKEEGLKPAKFSIVLWWGLAITAYITSLVIGKTIIYARYMLIAGGLTVFFMASTMAAKGRKFANIIIITVSILLSIFVTCTLVKENYGVQNREYKKYVNEMVQKEDILICSNELSGCSISTDLPENEIYFWDEQNWRVEEEYKAFGKTVYDFEFLKDYKGRIWLTSDFIYENVKEKYKDIKLIEKKVFNLEYKKQQYTLICVEK